MFRVALRTPTPFPALRAFSTSPSALKAFTVAEVNAKSKAMGIPRPPKSPMGAYAEYFKELYPSIRNDHIQENGKINSHEVARVAGARWSALSEQDKKKYKEAAKRTAEKYKSEYKRYYESVTDAQIADLGLESPALKGLGTRAKKAATREARGEPGRPVGSFFLFLHDFRKSDELKGMMERDGIEGAKVAIYTAKKAGEKWAVMSTEEKEQWVNQSEKQKETYAEWKEKNA